MSIPLRALLFRRTSAPTAITVAFDGAEPSLKFVCVKETYGVTNGSVFHLTFTL